MKLERQIYLLDPQVLPPETIAVTFAKTSRSPLSFQQIAAELSDAKSAEFNEKWVVGYGHSSVAEHAVLHIAVENISRLTVESLESNRLASYTEKSTRYQTWDMDAYHTPAELRGKSLEVTYTNTCTFLFEAYKSCLELVQGYLEVNTPHDEEESVSSRERRVRTQAIDVCRFLLPASSLANVGMTINARALEHAIGKMLASPLVELREIGKEIKIVASACVPTLLKYAEERPYLGEVCQKFSGLSIKESQVDDWCRLVAWDEKVIVKLLASAVYREQNIGYAQALEWVKSSDQNDRSALLKCLLGELDSHTIPARELEYVTFTFDLLMDQGAYYEVKRHRMMTQTPQHLTAHLGYAIPTVIQSAGALDLYCKAMDRARQTYLELEPVYPAVAAYIVPNGFNRRLLLKMNLRSALHFIKLRSAPNAHFSVRRIAQRIAEEISNAVPELENYLGRYESETSRSVEGCFFLRTS